jgi:hypothetical protein
MGIIVSTVLLVAVAISVVIFSLNAERKRRLRLSGRPTLVFAEWYDLYYRGRDDLPACDVQRIIDVIGAVIGIQATQLRPTDRLDSELSIPEAYPLDDSTESFEESLSDAFGVNVTFFPTWRTLDDVIHGVLKQVRR